MCAPPLCGNKNVITALRRAKKVCRLESWEWVPPSPLPDRRGDSFKYNATITLYSFHQHCTYIRSYQFFV